MVFPTYFQEVRENGFTVNIPSYVQLSRVEQDKLLEIQAREKTNPQTKNSFFSWENNFHKKWYLYKDEEYHLILRWICWKYLRGEPVAFNEKLKDCEEMKFVIDVDDVYEKQDLVKNVMQEAKKILFSSVDDELAIERNCVAFWFDAPSKDGKKNSFRIIFPRLVLPRDQWKKDTARFAQNLKNICKIDTGISNGLRLPFCDKFDNGVYEGRPFHFFGLFDQLGKEIYYPNCVNEEPGKPVIFKVLLQCLVCHKVESPFPITTVQMQTPVTTTTFSILPQENDDVPIHNKKRRRDQDENSKCIELEEAFEEVNLLDMDSSKKFDYLEAHKILKGLDANQGICFDLIEKNENSYISKRHFDLMNYLNQFFVFYNGEIYVKRVEKVNDPKRGYSIIERDNFYRIWFDKLTKTGFMETFRNLPFYTYCHNDPNKISVKKRRGRPRKEDEEQTETKLNLKKTSLGDFWLSSPLRNDVDVFKYDPSLRPGQHRYHKIWNTWTGCLWNKKTLLRTCVEEHSKQILIIFQHLFYVLCSSDIKKFWYLLQWFAWIVQKPHEKTQVCPIFHGMQGAGKSLFIEKFGNCFGSSYSYVGDSHLFGHAHGSGMFDAKHFILVDEANMSDSHTSNFLKSVVSQNKMMLNQKFKEMKVIDNFLEMVICTNEKHVIKAENFNRRYVICKVSYNRVNDHHYFDRLENCWNEYGKEIFAFFMSLDISHFNPKNIVVTPELRDQILRSNNDSIRDFWNEKLITMELINMNVLYHKNQLYLDDNDKATIQTINRRWLMDLGPDARLEVPFKFLWAEFVYEKNKSWNKTSFRMKLNEIIHPDDSFENKDFFEIPCLKICKENYEKITNVPFTAKSSYFFTEPKIITKPNDCEDESTDEIRFFEKGVGFRFAGVDIAFGYHPLERDSPQLMVY